MKKKKPKTQKEPDSAIEYLCRQTDTWKRDWREVEGPDSGHGVDHWFVNKNTGEEVYVNNDQGDFSMSTEREP